MTLLTQREATALLRLSERTLERMRVSGGAQGPDPVQALLQAGPPDAVQPPLAAEGTLWCLVAADAGRALLRRIAAKRANVVLLNIFISWLSFAA